MANDLDVLLYAMNDLYPWLPSLLFVNRTCMPCSVVFQNWRDVVGELERGEGVGSDPMTSREAFLLVQQVCANVMAYCRVTMTMGGKTIVRVNSHSECQSLSM